MLVRLDSEVFAALGKFMTTHQVRSSGSSGRGPRGPCVYRSRGGWRMA